MIFCGNVDDGFLSKLLASAQASIYPSYFEGFGLPVLEAFACGVPVITTKNSAMEEIAEDAAFLFNALNIFELENAMLKLANGCDDVSQKIEKGLAIAKKHSWDITADKIWTSLLKIVT